MNAESLVGRKNVFYRKPDRIDGTGSVPEQKRIYAVKIKKVFDTPFPVEDNKNVVNVRIAFNSRRKNEIASSDQLFPNWEEAELAKMGPTK